MAVYGAGAEGPPPSTMTREQYYAYVEKYGRDPTWGSARSIKRKQRENGEQT